MIMFSRLTDLLAGTMVLLAFFGILAYLMICLTRSLGPTQSARENLQTMFAKPGAKSEALGVISALIIGFGFYSFAFL